MNSDISSLRHDDDLLGIKQLRVLLALLAIEGLLAVLTSLLLPSMNRRAVLLGYSLERIMVSAAFLGLCFAFLIAAIKTWLDAGWARGILKFLDGRVIGEERRLLGAAVVLLTLTTIGAYLIYLFIFYGVPKAPYALQIAFERFKYPIAWVVAIFAQSLIFLVLRYRKSFRSTTSSLSKIPYIVLFTILVGTGIHWITLALRSDLWIRIPGWFWRLISPKMLQASHAFLLIAAGIGFITVRSVMRQPHRKLRNLILCVGLAYILQVCFGFALGNGYQSIRLKYANSGLSAVAHLGCDSQANILQTVTNYEELYGQRFGLRTKPPGLVVFYQSIGDLIGVADPEVANSSESCFHTMTSWFAIILPLVTSLVVVPLYFIEGALIRGSQKFVSSLIFMSVPSVLLMTLLPDQFLFPLLFMVTVLAIALTVTRRSFKLGLLAGCLVYLSTFLSFSLLPVIGLAVTWSVLEYVLGDRAQGIAGVRNALLGIFLGIVVLWLAGRLLLEYDPVVRYQVALSQHRANKAFEVAPISLLQTFRLNNTEFVMWTGWPLIVLLVAGWLGSTARTFKGIADRKDIYTISVLVTYVALNAFGQTKGEVGRLWIFIVPLAAIVASRWAVKLLQDPVKSVLLVFMLQIATAAVGFIYFDFR